MVSRLTLRSLLVFSVLVIPMFVQGGRLMFTPFFALYNWGANWLYYHQADIGPGTVSNFLGQVALAVAVPVAVALLFALGDRLRNDISSVRGSSRALINLALAFCSFWGLVFAMGISDGNGGPVMIWGSSMLSYRSPIDVLLGTAFVLVAIEQATYWIPRAFRKSA